MIPVPVIGMGVVIRFVSPVVMLCTKSFMEVTIPCAPSERNRCCGGGGSRATGTSLSGLGHIERDGQELLPEGVRDRLTGEVDRLLNPLRLAHADDRDRDPRVA